MVKEKAELLQVLERESKKLGDESDKLYDLYQSNMIDKQGFGLKYRPLTERRDQLDNQIPELQAQIDILKIAHLSEEVAIEEARDLHSKWPTLSSDEKRRIVEAIVEKITIGDGEVLITLYYTPPPPVTPSSTGGKGGTSPPTTSSPNRGISATHPQGLHAATS